MSDCYEHGKSHYGSRADREEQISMYIHTSAPRSPLTDSVMECSVKDIDGPYLSTLYNGRASFWLYCHPDISTKRLACDLDRLDRLPIMRGELTYW